MRPALAALIALPLAVPATGALAQSSSAPRSSAPQLVAPRETPSGARSPARTKRVRKGTVARQGFRATAPATAVPAAPGTTSAPAAPNAAPATNPVAAPDPAALSRSLAIPENADVRAWVDSGHAFEAPRGDRHFMPFTDWSDDVACITRRENDTKCLRAGCKPADYQVRVTVDRAYGEALEAHFGFPACAMEPIRCTTDDGGCAAVEAAVVELVAQHGIICTPDRIMPDHQWVLDRSVPAVQDVANAVIRAYWGAGAPVNPRQRVEALASFVQNAVPYRPVKGAKDDLIRDGKMRCGLRTPVATLFEGGDCDSKALLLASLIRSVDATMPLSLVYCLDGDGPHMVLAVGCARAEGEAAISAGGSTQVLVETTSDWDLGVLGSGIDLADAEFVGLR
jgi:hypothetical protein